MKPFKIVNEALTKNAISYMTDTRDSLNIALDIMKIIKTLSVDPSTIKMKNGVVSFTAIGKNRGDLIYYKDQIYQNRNWNVLATIDEDKLKMEIKIKTL